MKKITYNMNQLIRIELIDTKVDPYWKYHPQRKNIFNKTIKAYWERIFPFDNSKYETPDINDYRFVKDNQVFFKPKIEFRFSNDIIQNAYFSSYEEAEEMYEKIRNQKMPNKMEIN